MIITDTPSHLMTPVQDATKIQHCHCTSARSMCDRRSPGCSYHSL